MGFAVKGKRTQEPKQTVRYYSPGPLQIAQFVRNVCAALVQNGDISANTADFQAGLTEFMEVVTAIGVQRMNQPPDELFDNESDGE